MSWKKYIEDTFAAVAFAEKGLDLSGFGVNRRALTVRTLVREVRDVYSAVAFAEENCHDTALEILKKKAARPSLGKFLEDVGLANVPIKLCVVNI
ncbi:hypothetical protein [Thermodesulforhabdus norvegica]|uniref:Uncharacterized protein n=1 Tax=Thermodesulforhabdus norvegica TaxID=39841 RepID=A0A1I4SGD6_9BACT|nr:hypothetical protein [Thermodesulforhabdus norvegica]SFM63529.1 hypothetical protein SAMN05660836_00950 [Thermodesulforhabdus norvegica]